MFLNKSKGFSLVEVLVALAVVGIISTGVITMQSNFAVNTNDRVIYSCLSQIAADAMMRCQSGADLITEVECETYKFEVEKEENTGFCKNELTANTCTSDSNGKPAVIHVTFERNGKEKKTSQTSHICNFD